MDQWIKDLWAKNKLLFILLIPVVLIIAFRNVLIGLLVKDSRKIAVDAEAEDKALLKKQNEANAKANQIIEDTNRLGENKTRVDEDWNK